MFVANCKINPLGQSNNICNNPARQTSGRQAAGGSQLVVVAGLATLIELVVYIYELDLDANDDDDDDDE